VFRTLTGTAFWAGAGGLVKKPKAITTRPKPKDMRRILPNFFIVVFLLSGFLWA
jgi:hypothetical protein